MRLEGFYRGKVCNLPLGWLWQGKIFDDQVVINKILGFKLIQGDVIYCSECVIIVYPMLGLRDTLIPVTPEFWLGILKLWKFTIYFTLRRDQ